MYVGTPYQSVMSRIWPNKASPCPSSSHTNQDQFCLLGLKMAEEQQYRDYFKPDIIKYAYGKALMQIFECTNMPEVKVSWNQTPTTRGFHVCAGALSVQVVQDT